MKKTKQAMLIEYADPEVEIAKNIAKIRKNLSTSAPTTPAEVTLKETCDICKLTYSYETLAANIERGSVPAEDLPDGYFLPDHKTNKWLWICDKCGSCPTCGKTLEKEPEKRAHRNGNTITPAKTCRECEQEQKEQGQEIFT